MTSGARYHLVATSVVRSAAVLCDGRALTFSHETLLLRVGHCGLGAARQAKVTDFKVAVGIEEEIGGFKVPVDDWGKVRAESSN
jgi:hypothetical protein